MKKTIPHDEGTADRAIARAYSEQRDPEEVLDDKRAYQSLVERVYRALLDLRPKEWRQIIRWRARRGGKSNAWIATRLDVSENTLLDHKRQAFETVRIVARIPASVSASAVIEAAASVLDTRGRPKKTK